MDMQIYRNYLDLRITLQGHTGISFDIYLFIYFYTKQRARSLWFILLVITGYTDVQCII